MGRDKQEKAKPQQSKKPRGKKGAVTRATIG
jgi:hypothetical protein